MIPTKMSVFKKLTSKNHRSPETSLRSTVPHHFAGWGGGGGGGGGDKEEEEEGGESSLVKFRQGMGGWLGKMEEIRTTLLAPYSSTSPSAGKEGGWMPAMGSWAIFFFQRMLSTGEPLKGPEIGAILERVKVFIAVETAEIESGSKIRSKSGKKGTLSPMMTGGGMAGGVIGGGVGGLKKELKSAFQLRDYFEGHQVIYYFFLFFLLSFI